MTSSQEKVKGVPTGPTEGLTVKVGVGKATHRLTVSRQKMDETRNRNGDNMLEGGIQGPKFKTEQRDRLYECKRNNCVPLNRQIRYLTSDVP